MNLDREKDQPRNDEPRINRRIRVPKVRVIGADGAQLGILNTEDARRLAEEQGLDLVEVQPNQTPPVCKIVDYGKYKYEQKKRANENKKSQKTSEVKEVKFSPGTDTHDFDTKLRKIREFLAEGHRARITVVFRGRQIVHRDLGADLCNRIATATADIAYVDRLPTMEGKALFMIIAPGKAPKAKAPTVATADDTTNKPKDIQS